MQPYIPCAIIQGIAAVESSQTYGATEFDGWKQFNANYNSPGSTVVGNPNPGTYTCGYGILQVTDGMNGNQDNQFPFASFNPVEAASSAEYNISAGVAILVNRWKNIPYAVGDSDPRVIQHWYFAVWAYNGLNKNNPSSTTYDPNRVSWK